MTVIGPTIDEILEVAGQDPPRSWQRASTTATRTTQSREKLAPDKGAADRSTPSWREIALAPILCECPASKLGCAYHNVSAPAVPPLSQICIHLILADCRGADLVDLAQYMPVHLRRALMRHAAVHAPLTMSELTALCDGQGSLDGELIVVGDQPSFLRSWFRNSITGPHGVAAHRVIGADDDGNSEDSCDDTQSVDMEPVVLTSLSLVSAALSAPIFRALPASITHLALLNLPHPILLQKLATICPRLVFLDLSYNAWLDCTPGWRAQNLLMDVDWWKHRYLQVLGLRGTALTSKLLARITQGRLEDIKVVTSEEYSGPM